MTAPFSSASRPPPFPEWAEQPIRYLGTKTTDKRWHHGGLPAVVGVHRYQALRATRSVGVDADSANWTYNHQPLLAYWKGRFWIQYTANEKEEHAPPCVVGVISSVDGRHWSRPSVGFPSVNLPALEPPPRFFGGRQLPPIPAGSLSILHQRMGWYTAPDGRLLLCGFYSYCPNPRLWPNRGQGLGRVVREVNEDGTFGPIYFVRHNRQAGWDETNTPFPFFRFSRDDGFIAACAALLADKLVTLQWWEEDRATDGFFSLVMPAGIEPKALSYFTRSDGVTVALWKKKLAALSPDGGQTWLPFGRYDLPDASSKIWGQQTSDGRFALAYVHSATESNRFPLSVLTSDDGHAFDHLCSVHCEVPPVRYQGIYKRAGPQYVRGLEGEGQPPDGNLWLTYSVSKEDLWVARIRVPVTASPPGHRCETFENLRDETELAGWNLYCPQWAPITIVEDPARAGNHCLELRDEEPYDYAKAECFFPEASRVIVRFRVMQQEVGAAKLEIEVLGAAGARALRLRFERDSLGFDLGQVSVEPVAMDVGRWHDIELNIDCGARYYDVHLDGIMVRRQVRLADPVPAVGCIEFRTGPWRMDVRQSLMEGDPSPPGLNSEDLPAAHLKVAGSVFLVDDVATGIF